MIRPAEKVEDGYCLANKKLGFNAVIFRSAQWLFALNVAVSCPHPFRNLGSRRWTPREFKTCLATKRSTRPHLSTTRTLCLHTSTLALENQREGEYLEFGSFFCADDAVWMTCACWVLSGERLGWGRHSSLAFDALMVCFDIIIKHPTITSTRQIKLLDHTEFWSLNAHSPSYIRADKIVSFKLGEMQQRYQPLLPLVGVFLVPLWFHKSRRRIECFSPRMQRAWRFTRSLRVKRVDQRLVTLLQLDDLCHMDKRISMVDWCFPISSIYCRLDVRLDS